MMDANKTKKASHGVDAPGFLPFAVLAFVASIAAAIASRKPAPFLGAALLLVCFGFFVHTTRRGKFLVWSKLIDGLRLKGSERILDLGCGRGAVLLTAAKRLTTGRAFGVDI